MTMVIYEVVKPGVGKITLNDPDNLNAMGEQMAAQFLSLISKLRNEAKSLRALIITGAGRAFSAGGDLDMLEKKRALSGEENRLRMLNFYHSFLDIVNLGVPLIAAINGHAVGAGLCLASACDIRIAGDKAKLGFTFTKLGLHPGMGATYFLPRVVGYSRAVELLITGRMLSAEEALQIGLVSKVVGSEAVLTEATSIANEICECGPEAVRQVLESLRTGAATLTHSLEREAACQGINYTSAEFAEGLKATREKRKANFNS